MQDPTQQGTQKNTFVALDERDCPDLAPSDFHLFPALKSALSGRHFRTCSANRSLGCEELLSIAGHSFLAGWFLGIDFTVRQERSKSESEAAAAEAQMHLSRVRQRISELLDDAFALAGGRRLYGSLRSKKIEPTTEVLPRFGSFRSQSATGGELTIAKRQGSISIERRPISEGGQRLLGVLTDEGQLITHPPPKLVWDQDEGYPVQGIERPLGTEMVEARNRNINLFPFQPQRIHQLPALPSASSLPLLDTLPESRQDAAGVSPTHALREAASELYLPLSASMNPATGDQYDELDVVSALRNGEPVEALIQAIKDELQRFAGSLPGAEDGESNA
ncbi:hypothetical protein AVEN_56571-1 [Araneus ventricosus]|uniref:Uncharacterized protein n=1 Tax=Araneus ventricosus TaxID=182803 RepID=A0A4Y2K316_ARAVE|nr:hypothetical protein AVEN_56571-1 [Araneus ventricosus]